MATTRNAGTEPRPLTGRTVLLCFLAFFGVVGSVNAVMIRAATSTFGGVETGSAYKAGLEFKNELAAARRQSAERWQVRGSVSRDRSGHAIVEVLVADAHGAALAGLSAAVRLSHPTNARLDRAIELRQVAPGRFRGDTELPPGQRDFTIDLTRGELRVFRSKSRIVLQ